MKLDMTFALKISSCEEDNFNLIKQYHRVDTEQGTCNTQKANVSQTSSFGERPFAEVDRNEEEI